MSGPCAHHHFVSLAPSSRGVVPSHPIRAPSSRRKPCSLTAGKTTRENSSFCGFHLLTFLYTPPFLLPSAQNTFYHCMTHFPSLQRLLEAPENPSCHQISVRIHSAVRDRKGLVRVPVHQCLTQYTMHSPPSISLLPHTHSIRHIYFSLQYAIMSANKAFATPTNAISAISCLSETLLCFGAMSAHSSILFSHAFMHI